MSLANDFSTAGLYASRSRFEKCRDTPDQSGCLESALEICEPLTCVNVIWQFAWGGKAEERPSRSLGPEKSGLYWQEFEGVSEGI
jgi:hypothetical protein